ncbi:MFS family permease [Kibdelosporangium phytohabitans]|uniref:Major facilitator superfamily (MFS) profile domain-containing protein n=1 Tax=Kibdelosporangium phytohabitans TaxID=860235 RepID=A0A0N9HWG7_9PSEU|nr:hypothetical protein AOZ06_24445 [Kibdelosporangium phytohabitans]MBE1469026.1 MFS family permease [Kibdelosporangium phytohabitans]
MRAHPKFLRVWTGQVPGAIGDQLVPVALSVYVVQNGGNVGTVAGVLGGRALGLGLCLVIGGMLADRVSRSKLIACADAYRATVTVLFALLLSHLPFGLLGVGTILIGAGEAIARPGCRSLVPSLLPASLLERGNALVSPGLRSSAVLGSLAGAGTSRPGGATGRAAGRGGDVRAGCVHRARHPRTATGQEVPWDRQRRAGRTEGGP